MKPYGSSLLAITTPKSYPPGQARVMIDDTNYEFIIDHSSPLGVGVHPTPESYQALHARWGADECYAKSKAAAELIALNCRK